MCKLNLAQALSVHSVAAIFLLHHNSRFLTLEKPGFPDLPIRSIVKPNFPSSSIQSFPVRWEHFNIPTLIHMNKSVVGLMSTHLKKRGICSSPLLARIFLHSLCFSSTSSFFLSVFSIFPSSRSLTTPTQSKRKTEDLKKKHFMDLLYFEHN